MNAVFMTDDQIATLHRLFAEIGKQRGLHPGMGADRFLLEFPPISQALDKALPIGDDIISGPSPTVIHISNKDQGKDSFIFRAPAG